MQLGGDVVIDESVCPDSATRLADAPWDLNLLSTHADCLVSMGDSEGAREILEEVILEGNDEQKTDAQSLLKKLP